jgi:SAM-dependent methyltransferase
MNDRRAGWRLRVAKLMRRAARGFDFFSLAIPRADDLVASNRRFYMRSDMVSGLSQHVAGGLFPHECAAIERFVPAPGRAVVLGCGAGREAIGLARRGWHVTAIDVSPAAIESARRNAAEAGVTVDWQCRDISSTRDLEGSYELISLLGLVYSLIPDRSRRISLLHACGTHLSESGVVLLDFVVRRPVSPLEIRAHKWRKRLARVVGGNTGCEIGDEWQLGDLFLHVFASEDDVGAEVAEAGLKMESHGGETHAPIAVLSRRRG